MSGTGGMSGSDWAILATESDKLSDAKLLKIYSLLEHMRDKPEVAGAFAALRPRLVELRPPRRISVSRLLFRPVEDLLDDAEAYQRRLNRISRAVLVPAWRALKERLPRPVVEGVQGELAGTDSRDLRRLAQVGEPLWAAGAETLTTLMTEARANLKVQVALFGRDDDVLTQLDTVVDVLRVGPRIETLKLSLPSKPIGDLAESHVDTIKTQLSELGREFPRLTTPVLLVLTSRMKRPGDLLKMLQEVRLGGTPQDKEGLTKDLSGIVVGNLLRQTSDMDRNSQSASSEDLAATAERLTEGLNSVNDTVLNLKDREMSRKVDGARAEIGDFVKRTIVADVDRTLITSLFSPDIAASAGEQVKKAEQLALALRKSAKLAPHLGIKRDVDSKIAEVRKQVERETEAALRDRDQRTGLVSAEAQRRMFNSLRVIEILAGSDEAERLYRDWHKRMA
ncbi:MAG: hypothetical protein RLY86_913 [Pseudomonadota bacterium]|jgi:hypothetical protein